MRIFFWGGGGGVLPRTALWEEMLVGTFYVWHDCRFAGKCWSRIYTESFWVDLILYRVGQIKTFCETELRRFVTEKGLPYAVTDLYNRQILPWAFYFMWCVLVCPQKLALTSPTGGGRYVGMVRSRTKATEFSFSLVLVCKDTEGK